MDTTTVAHPAQEPTTRVQRGRELYREHAHSATSITYRDGSWYVPSATVEGKFYAVRLGPVETCECPDHEHRGAKCMHVTAATIARAKSTVCSCCGNRVAWRFVTEATEDDSLLSWFPGDRLCGDCVHGGYWA